MELNHNQQYLVEEFAEEYLARRMGRRDLLKRILIITGSVPAAAALLVSLGCGSSDDSPAATSTIGAASPQTVAPTATTAAGASGVLHVDANDPAIVGADVRFPGPASEMRGYLARPSASGTFPGVILCHENRGLLDHFKDVSRRYAKEGFVALAVDLASRKGGSTSDPVANMGNLTTAPADILADLTAGVAYLKTQSQVKAGALGVSGFCFGGNCTFELATGNTDIKAAVPYYGTASADALGRIAQTKAAYLNIYGGADTRVTGQSADVEQRLRAAGKTVQAKIYDGAGHAFFNDTGTAYNAAAATDAWKITLDWFKKYLV